MHVMLEYAVREALMLAQIREDRAFSASNFRIHAERQSGRCAMGFLLPLMFVTS